MIFDVGRKLNMNKSRLKNYLSILAMLNIAGLLFLIIQPINRFSYILIEIVLIACSISIIYILSTKRKIVICALVIFSLTLLLPFANQSEISKSKLRERYLNNLISYVDTEYVWGGENSLGIDCSGLPRKSMRLALIEYGYSNFNGRAIKMALWMTFNDASANEMLNGYSGLTSNGNAVYRINDLSNDINPGDMAITENGIHCMVYLDKAEIIQADPGRNKVVCDGIPSEQSWYHTNVYLVRWSVLQ